MTFWETSGSDFGSGEVRRWVPPDVSLPQEAAPKPEPSVPMATEAEVNAVRRAAEEAGSKAGYEAGYMEGYQKGFEEGQVAAEQEAQEEQRARDEREQAMRAEQEAILKETVGALEGVARDLADPLASMVDSLEPELLALTGAVARRVVMAELATTPDLIKGVLTRALNQLPSRNHVVRVRVNPQEEAVLAAHAEASGESVTWLADPEVERGGCIVESGPSRIDATLDARLRQAIDAIWGELMQPEPAEEPPEAEAIEPAPEALQPEYADAAEAAFDEDAAEPAPNAASVKPSAEQWDAEPEAASADVPIDDVPMDDESLTMAGGVEPSVELDGLEPARSDTLESSDAELPSEETP